FRQDDLETAQFLEMRCGSKSGFAHSKTAHEGGTSTGESEQKIPVITAQYIMYDMPDDEIIIFWGKRPFLGKRIPRRNEHAEGKSQPSEAPEVRPSPVALAVTEPAKAEASPSWRTDPTLFRHRHPK